MKDTLSVDNPGDLDTPLSSKLIKEWWAAIKEGTAQYSIWFPPSTSSSQAVKKPWLLGKILSLQPGQNHLFNQENQKRLCYI